MPRLTVWSRVLIAQALLAGLFTLGMFAHGPILIGAAVFTIFCLIALNFSVLKTLNSLSNAVRMLKKESRNAHHVGRSLVSTARTLAETSTQQAASIEETSASLEEINSMISSNAQNSAQAKDLAERASRSAVEGKTSMESLIHSMEEISGSSKKIEEIMQIIDDIAFQINLLALNASVEAARAGEHGKGFAVVAEAVRSLAHKSASSAKQIGDLIQDSLHKISHGQNLAQQSGGNVHRIAEDIGELLRHNNEIATASHEQALGINQISKAISALEKGTIENSAAAEKTLHFSRESLAEAEGLLRVVDVLEVELEGGASAAPAASEELDFDSAVEAHLKWKARLANFISGMGAEKLKSEIVCKDDQCQLGKWIHGAGQKFGKLSVYGQLKSHHAHFHEAAAEVVRAVEQKNIPKAKSLLAENSDFGRYTDLTVDSLFKLKESLEGDSREESRKSA